MLEQFTSFVLGDAVTVMMYSRIVLFSIFLTRIIVRGIDRMVVRRLSSPILETWYNSLLT